MHKANIFLYLISGVSGIAGAWIIRTFGSKLRLIDIPNKRSSHSKITPKGGGVGILVAFFISALFLSLSASFWIPAVFISLLSIYGDRYEISPRVRLILHFLASFAFLIGLTGTFHNDKMIDYGIIVLLSFFMVGTSNLYNFMDGIDGIAGITGIIGFGLLALYANLSGSNPVFMYLCLAIIFSCIGFLYFNFPKAKVFMGDVGSILLGFVFSAMVILISKNIFDFICLTCFLFPFYADELNTMILRIRDGDNLTQPHRKHFYQILANEYTIPHWKISIGYGLSQLIIGLAIIYFKKMGLIVIAVIISICYSGSVVLFYKAISKLELVQKSPHWRTR
jgi:Fuc2NAc and GlcNAc transferase